MPTRDEIRATAREKMGWVSITGIREWGLLAKLLAPGEEIEALVLGKLRGGVPIARQRFVVVTPARVLLVEKGFFTGRERVRELGWDEIRDVEPDPPSRLTLELTDERIELTVVQPPAQLAAVTDRIRERVAGDARRQGATELLEIVRRKLGRFTSFAIEVNTIALAEVLAPEEQVLDVAFVGGTPHGLLAVTTRRVVFVPSRGGGTGTPETLALDEVAEAAFEEDRAVVIGGRRWDAVAPPDRASSLVDIVRARAGARLP